MKKPFLCMLGMWSLFLGLALVRAQPPAPNANPTLGTIPPPAPSANPPLVPNPAPGINPSLPTLNPASGALPPPPLVNSEPEAKITVSDDRLVARGYSPKLGKWVDQQLDMPLKESSQALIGKDVAMISGLNNTFYAFSAITGDWNILRLAPNSERVVFWGDGASRVGVDADE